MFKLKRPCNNCPFRKGMGANFRLPKARLDEIASGAAFQCHKTIDYDEFDDVVARQGEHPQQCAGLMAVLHREGRTNQIMQVATRLGGFNPDTLDPDNEAYESLDEAYAEHEGAEV